MDAVGFNVTIGIFVLAMQNPDAPNLAILPYNPNKSMIKVIFLNFGHVVANMLPISLLKIPAIDI